MELAVVVAVGILVFACVAGLFVLKLVQSLARSSESVSQLAENCLSQMQNTHEHTAHKLESWHESSMARQVAHTERVMAIVDARESERLQILQLQAQERQAEHVTAATHLTNEARADVIRIQARAGSNQDFPEANNDVRRPVPRSKSSVAREKINEGHHPVRGE